MTESTSLTKQQIVAELIRSAHGDLKQYVPLVTQAAKSDPDFLAHLIAYNREKGEVRDSKVALPLISLSVPMAPEYVDNALAHLALLTPRHLVQALEFSRSNLRGSRRGLVPRRLIERYLRAREAKRPWFDRQALQFRAALRTLYTVYRVKPSPYASVVLFGRNLDKTPAELLENSVFAKLRALKTMAPHEAAGTIMEYKIPFLIAAGALGARMKETPTLLALIKAMSPTELQTNMKRLEKLGVRSIPELRAALEQALVKTAGSTRTALKTSRAIDAVEDDGLKEKLRAVQEKQLDRLAGIEGNWLILGDKSGSMDKAIETARMIAGAMARLVKGKVSLVFFDTAPRYFDVTGKTMQDIASITRGVSAGGGTSHGCGLLCAVEKRVPIDGIAVVSDGAENSLPFFVSVYSALCQSEGKTIPVYSYRLNSSESTYACDAFGRSMTAGGFELQEFDLRNKPIDYYSVLDLAKTMRTERYGLLQEIQDAPLLTLDSVFGQRVVAS